MPEPQDRRQADFNTAPRGKHHVPMRPPPKPGISNALLAWVIVMVAVGVFAFLTLMMHYHVL